MTQKYRYWSGWYTALLMVLGIIFIIAMVPRSYNSEFSHIGQGQRVAVLIHDSKKFPSVFFMSLMNGIRADYEDRVKFLVADIREAQGKAFAEKQQLSPPTLLLFDSSGERQGEIGMTHSQKNLATSIDQLYNFTQ